ncbi:putative leucine-rich repeat-containing protein, partial [Aphis craccivora]
KQTICVSNFILLFIFNFITLGIRLICLEVQKQIMRQLVTFNARQKEQGEYLHTIMMIVSNIHDTQKNLIVSPSLGSNQQFEKIYKLLLISTNDELNIFKGALTDDNILYDQIVNMLSTIGGDNYKQANKAYIKKSYY